MLTPQLPVVDWTDASRRFKWNCPFCQKTKSGFRACAITFQTQFTAQKVFGDTLQSCYLEEGANNDIWCTRSSLYNYTVPLHRNITSCRPSPVLSWNTVSGMSHPLCVCVRVRARACVRAYALFHDYSLLPFYSVYIQGGSNMTGTDLYVNKPHCAAAVRPW